MSKTVKKIRGPYDKRGGKHKTGNTMKGRMIHLSLDRSVFFYVFSYPKKLRRYWFIFYTLNFLLYQEVLSLFLDRLDIQVNCS